MKKRIISSILAIYMAIFTWAVPVSANTVTEATTVSSADVLSVITKTASYNKQVAKSPTTGPYFGDWTVLGVARSVVQLSGLNTWYKQYAVNAKKDIDGMVYPSEYGRAIIGLSSIGVDVTNFNNVNLVERMTNNLKDIQSSPYNAIYTLLALDTKNYEIPTDSAIISRDYIVDAVLAFQCKDEEDAYNLYGFGDKYTDVDTTAMAIQALAPYYLDEKYSKNAEVKEAVDNALTYLKNNQKDSGGYGFSADYDSSCSTAQVLLALSCLKLDPLASENGFTKGDNNLYTSLMNCYNSQNGAFKEIQYDSVTYLPTGLADDPMATDQCLYALVGYYRYLENSQSLFDMTKDTVSLPPDATSLTLNRSTLTITGIKKTSTLSVKTVKPSSATKLVTWKSSNEKIATVDKNGKIKSVAPGKVKITAIAVQTGTGSRATASCTVTVKLAKPTALKAAVGKKKVTVTFKKVTGAKKYEIYKYNGKKWIKVKTTTGGTYTDKSVKVGKKYKYRVRAINGTNKSDYTSTVTSKNVKK